jgi:hypothetical protein
MQIDPLVEWQRLIETYSKMYDGELLELAEDAGNLTDQAQQVLSDEMRKRGLGSQRSAGTGVRIDRAAPDPMLERAAVALGADPGAPELVSDDPETGEDGESGDEGAPEYTWKTPLCECEGGEEAWQIREVLRRAGIESWVEGPGGSYSPYSQLLQGTPRILVPADRLEEARAIVTQPIPKEIVEQSRMQLPEFEAPTCPKCGAGDPVLEGVDPVNSWLCEACGHEWAESAANLEDGPDKTK